MKKALFTILAVLTLDQWLKIWVKLNFHYGESMEVFPGILDLQFVENPGMAFGWMLPGEGGKLALSIFRIIVVSAGIIYLIRQIKNRAHRGFIICVSLIVSGALGNIVDSTIYGVIFDKGSMYSAELEDYRPYFDKAELNGEGYAKPLMGNVVDMFHFTIKFTWDKERYELFPPVFNIADSAITIGIILILFFQRKFFSRSKHDNIETEQTIEDIALNTEAESALPL
ncbi:MAG: signal peptidase II [Flavobacteriales bacterium]